MLQLLVEVGMTPMQAIQAGTRVDAELLMWDDRIGSIAVGKLADIIAVPGDLFAICPCSRTSPL